MSAKGQGQIPEVPSVPEIQKTLVKIGDKGQDFVGSKQWIGSVEVCLCLDTLYDVSRQKNPVSHLGRRILFSNLIKILLRTSTTN